MQPVWRVANNQLEKIGDLERKEEGNVSIF